MTDNLYTFIALDEFKALLGIDDREDKICRFCLVTAALSIEQYCKRKFLKKSHNEYIPFFGDLLLPLNEFPVSKITAIFSMSSEQLTMSNGIIVEPEFYCSNPVCGTDIDIPFSIEFSPAVSRLRGLRGFKVIYWAGYPANKIPTDLSSACLELAAWNLNRYRGKRIGMTGNIKGAGIQGEHFEPSMPENVRGLLAPYVRRTI